MADRVTATLCYLPVPGAAFLAPWLRRDDRLVRFHAWQGGTLTLLLYVALAALSPLGASAAGRAVLATVALLGAALLAWGGYGAARGRYVRVRGVWDALALLGQGRPMRAS